LTKLDSFRLNGVNVYEQTEPNVKVGIWYVRIEIYLKSKLLSTRYILPSSVKIDHNLPTLADHLKQYVRSNDRPIIMYLHGQDGTR